ncbi:hypothetical protein CEUSTIGMA_g5480.t1 [Chlamydomonas eustigma]|uniref:UBZ4-type domain-containing protein n=1 Tax=Chlamydomonas eustigma TaxID=1157962 RepID=A0A250X4N5_9CHLO|nr:hypothetical protein CEUSTIGMA_g5480.t1 [Chlamydomonas eustigma]|eukprot:GAX78038.1 hypothetical protein CEUSTIGMA_g5480.t1 [Chlamydomonas eustigma]
MKRSNHYALKETPKTSQRAYAQCPMCTRTLPANVIAEHASLCGNILDPKKLKGPDPQSHIEDMTEQPVVCTTGVFKEIKSDVNKAPCSQANALMILMQRQHACVDQVFYLELTPVCGLQCYWWQKGEVIPPYARSLPPALWSKSMLMRLDSNGVEKKVLIQTNMKPDEDCLVTWDNMSLHSNSHFPPEGRWKGGIPALKSALQKCVRLGRASCAARCAMHLMKEDPSQLLRRLPIICLEDAILHPRLAVIVWIMAAQAKGYVFGLMLASEILKFTYEIASVKVKDILPTIEDNMRISTNQDGENSILQMENSLGDASKDEITLLNAINLRASFGGMSGDVVMLRGYSKLWSSRFRSPHQARLGHLGKPSTQLPCSLSSAWLQNLQGLYRDTSTRPCSSPHLVSAAAIGPLRIADVPLSSVDYHVSDVISSLLSQPCISKAAWLAAAASGSSEACLKSAMWLFRSGVNNRLLPFQSHFWAGQSGDVAVEDCANNMQLLYKATLEAEDSQKKGLRELWKLSAAHADEYSRVYIKRRFEQKLIRL